MANILEMLAKKKAALQAQSGNRERPAKLPAGRSKWRILPPAPGTDTMFHDFGMHFIKGTDGVTKAVYICVDKTYGRPCDICAAIQSGLNGADESLTNALNDSKAGGRVLVNALRRDGEEPNKPVVLDLPPSVFEKYIDIVTEYDRDGVNVLDLAEGHDIVIERSGSGMNTKYNLVATPRASKVDPKVLEQVTDLKAYVAQEYESGLNKALTSINVARGLLEAPRDVSPKKARKAAPEVDQQETQDLDDLNDAPFDADDDSVDELDALLADIN